MTFVMLPKQKLVIVMNPTHQTILMTTDMFEQLPTREIPDGLELQENTKIGGVNRSVFNVEVSRDGKTWERKYRFETEKSFQYPTFFEYQGGLYFVVTQGDHSKSRKERIMFGSL